MTAAVKAEVKPTTGAAAPAVVANTLVQNPGAGAVSAGAPSSATAARAPATPVPVLTSGWQAASAQAALSAQGNHQVTLNVHTDTLGTVQLHASLQSNVLGATLAVDRPDVHQWLSTQLPLLEQTLAAKQIQVGNLQLQAQTSGGGSGGAASHNSSQPQTATPRFFAPRAGAPPAPESKTPELAPALLPGARLNLRA